MNAKEPSMWSNEDRLADLTPAAALAHSIAPYIDAACVTQTPSRRRYTTPAQASAHTRGFNDFPVYIERGIVSYALGYHEAEVREDAKREDRAEAADARRQHEERGL